MIIRFVIYGLIGMLMEIFWTGILSLLKRDMSLRANTYLWMFFIYGLAVFLEPMFVLLKPVPLMARGLIYMALIFCAEYVTGFFLERSIGQCPWNYGGAGTSIYGFIRLDYAPVWFSVGLFYEFIYYFVLL